MGMSLIGSKGNFGFSWHGWTAVLKISYEHGWRPAGTVPSELVWESGIKVWNCTEPWSGTYFSNDGQEVTEKDARGIAEALERVLNDPCQRERWSGSGGQMVREFIAFCREGAFYIW